MLQEFMAVSQKLQYLRSLNGSETALPFSHAQLLTIFINSCHLKASDGQSTCLAP